MLSRVSLGQGRGRTGQGNSERGLKGKKIRRHHTLDVRVVVAGARLKVRHERYHVFNGSKIGMGMGMGMDM